jgi:thiamine-phosphate pyrophosphorylase
VKRPDLRVYVITAAVPELGRTHEDVAAAAIRGGATAIQFRDKTLSDEQFAKMARKIAVLTRAAGVPLIINDRVAIGIAIGADGVHIGQSDGDIREVRKSLPEKMILGVSATNYLEALEMDATDADYLGVGPIFPTGSKDDASPPIGVEELARICRDVHKPVVAIGGINQENLRCIIDSGAAGAAVISAVTQAPDMAAAVAQLRDSWHRTPVGLKQ